MVRLINLSSTECRKLERFLIQRIDRDIEDVMFLQNQVFGYNERDVREAEELLKKHSTELNKLQSYIQQGGF